MAKFAQAETAQLRTDLDAMRARAERSEAAIAWALGEKGDFAPRGPGQPPYWWRSELRRLASPAANSPTRKRAGRGKKR